jgi:hypothetical protein
MAAAGAADKQQLVSPPLPTHVPASAPTVSDAALGLPSASGLQLSLVVSALQVEWLSCSCCFLLSKASAYSLIGAQEVVAKQADRLQTGQF